MFALFLIVTLTPLFGYGGELIKGEKGGRFASWGYPLEGEGLRRWGSVLLIGSGVVTFFLFGYGEEWFCLSWGGDTWAIRGIGEILPLYVRNDLRGSLEDAGEGVERFYEVHQGEGMDSFCGELTGLALGGGVSLEL